jgi:hypothetical protein
LRFSIDDFRLICFPPSAPLQVSNSAFRKQAHFRMELH